MLWWALGGLLGLAAGCVRMGGRGTVRVGIGTMGGKRRRRGVSIGVRGRLRLGVCFRFWLGFVPWGTLDSCLLYL